MKLRALVVAIGMTAAAVQGSQPAQAYTLGQLVTATKAPTNAAFASVAVRAENAPQIEQWRRVVRATEGSRSLEDCLNSGRGCPGGYGASWRGMMLSARGMDHGAQADTVNRFFNRLAYRTDAQEYGQSDHWATPVEFLTRGAGDCEDFAIAKFFSLKALGFADDDLRVVAVFDRVERIGHAVLTVSIGGSRFVLDNRSDVVFPETRFRDYRPVLSMNEAGTWRNLQRSQAQARTLASVSSALNFR